MIEPLGEAIAEQARRVERERARLALATVAGASANDETLPSRFAIGAAVSSGVVSFLNPSGLAGEHRKASTRYRGIENRARVFCEISCAGAMPVEELPEKLSELDGVDEESPDAERLLARA